VTHPRSRTIVLTGALLEASLAVLAIALGAIAGVAPLSSISWNVRDSAIGIAAVLPLLGAFRLTWNSRAVPLRKIRRELERMLPEMFGDASPIGLALVSLAAGVGEELLFRGFLQVWLEPLLGTFGGLAAASLIFGAAHPITPGYVVVASLMGGYLGYLWQSTGNLWAPIVTHSLYDFVVLCVLLRRRS